MRQAQFERENRARWEDFERELEKLEPGATCRTSRVDTGSCVTTSCSRALAASMHGW